MPRRNNRQKRRRSGARVDTLHYPVVYVLGPGQSAVTTVKSLSEQFDRHRAFRVSSVRYQFSSEKAPCTVYSVAFSPVNTADSVWASRPLLVPTGTVVRGSWRIPVTATGWYPSDTLDTTYLFQVFCNCPLKGWPGRVSGTATFAIQLRPWEPDTSCPTLPLQTILSGPALPDDDVVVVDERDIPRLKENSS